MLSDAPVAVSLLFVVTVEGMLLLVLWGAMRAARRVGPGATRGVRLAGVALGGWLALTAALAERGVIGLTRVSAYAHTQDVLSMRACSRTPRSRSACSSSSRW